MAATDRLRRALVGVVALVATCGSVGAVADEFQHGADFSGTYEFVGPLIAIGPCDGRINGKWETRCVNYPFNERGRQTTIDARQDGSVNCVPDGLARLNTRTLYDIQFVYEPDAILIRYQYGDVERRIHLNGRPPPADTPHSLHGYSVGRWLGDTLYIETSHLSPAFFAIVGGGRIGGPTSEQARIIERWWPAPTPGNLLMDMVLDDPVYYERPFLLHRREWLRTDEGELEPWDCVDASGLLLDEEMNLDDFFKN